MTFFRQYAIIIGFSLLAIAVVLMLSSPDIIFSKGVSVIDTDLSQSSKSDNYIRTKLDFGDNEHIKAFPRQIGEWEGFDYDTEDQAESLGADVLLMRGYTAPGLYVPIYFLIMQSKDRTTFHPPTICYPALGYTIETEEETEILVSGTEWAETYGDSVTARKLVVYKESEGKVVERRLVLYFYVKQNPINPFTSDTVTMIRVSALIPTEGSYDSMLNVLQDFSAEAIPYMFDPYDKESSGNQRIAVQLSESGVLGYLAMIALFLLPITIILYPWIRPQRGNV